MEHEHGDEDDSPEAKCGFVLHITVLIFSGLYTAFTLLALIRPSNTADSILMTFLSWLKLDDDYSGEKLPDEDKTNGCGGASWLGEEDKTNWPNDVARTTYKDALVKSEE